MKKAEYFFQTLTPDILTPNEYVDWDRINQKVKEMRREIALLQSLDKENPVEDLTDLFKQNPNILKVLQLLIAHTPREIYFDDRNKHIDFKEDLKYIRTDRERAKEISGLFVEMGLVEFLKEVKSVEDVVKGVLIGLEPNSRKNRRGTIFETKIDTLIDVTISEINEEYGYNLSFESQMYVDFVNERKQVDYVIIDKQKQIIAIEVNFYSTSGSKPSEVLGRAYPEVQRSLETKNMGFIVITDGIGWYKMKPVISTAYTKLHNLMNIKQAQQGMLKETILELYHTIKH
ncbi:hypothetical protein C5S30_06405 [ANME-1 cluster archaeon GoMg4]|nr:hypothetical protein [ANME-1 cluster archaeon GoMg4]